ncbi:MAG: AAA family ATPase [Candidatus Omnitrophica bacterium]|nr:AAA family ATPase [Candidatus Omnitrophota bacterium]MBU4477731.1 AAA family ATPase [Candidatus Omnitrophota bacterium]MCG2703023.1 AAA family ATPase [Candidatus Omnitrophota bacterium]
MPQYELNLRDYVRIFRRRKSIIFLTFILVVFISAFFSRSGELVYEASTTVKIEERKTVAGLLTEWIVYSPGDLMESETNLITGYPVLKSVALKIGIISPDFPEKQVNEAMKALHDKVRAERIGTTNIIRIIAQSVKPQEVIELANTVAEVYIEQNLLSKTQQARNARKFIEEQLSSLETRLKEKEELLRDKAKINRNIAVAEPIQRRLMELQFELSTMLQKYTQKHPNVIQLKEQINELDQQLSGLSSDDLEYSRLSREVEADKKLYSLLKEKLEEARITEAGKVAGISVVDPAVTADAIPGPNRTFGIIISAILGLVLGFAFALVLESLDTSIGTIEDVEGIMHVPVLGVIPSVSMDDEEKSKRRFFFRFKRKILSKPKTEEEERHVRLILQYNPKSPGAEAYRNIYTNLKLDGTKKTFLITSAGPREGKSTALTNLGLAIAQTGVKVIIVSSDIRRPSLAKTFGIKREPGLTEVLLGMMPLDEAVRNITDFMLGEMKFDDIQRTPGLDNLWLLPSGQLPFNPAKLLESKELTNLIEEMKERFDIIIFDSPPILPVTDASILATQVDAVIMIYEIGRTSRDALLRAKNQLDAVGAKVEGIVLNQTRSETDVDVIFPYYYKYRYYREEDMPEKGKKTKKQSVPV